MQAVEAALEADEVGGPGARGARVEARGLTRYFGRRCALDDVSLEIRPGETFGLLGANGAGKTTFIRLTTGYIIPSDGAVTVDGLSPADDARAVQRRLGYVPETPRLYPELRVDAFLRFVAGVRDLPRAEAKRAVEEALARFQLEVVSRRPIAKLSKGYLQRVSLAQGFLHHPALLIVDEPTSGLDPLQREEVRGVLKALRGLRTILVCTHDLTEARALTTRSAVLYEGRLVAMGNTAELLGGEDPLALFRGDAVAEGGTR